MRREYSRDREERFFYRNSRTSPPPPPFRAPIRRVQCMIRLRCQRQRRLDVHLTYTQFIQKLHDPSAH